MAQLAREYLESLLAGDREHATRIVLEAVEGDADIRDVYLHVLQPAQREIGRLWQIGEIGIAKEPFCTAVTQQVISRLSPMAFQTERNGRRMMAVCAGPELHEVGLRIELVTTQRRLAKKNAELEKVYRQMREMAVRDPLTGVYNRRGLREQAAREIGRIARRGGSIVVLACDLDDLKTINDRHGHAAGDRVIESLARRWTAELRKVPLHLSVLTKQFVYISMDP